jgi:hypothetical protein
VSLSKIHHRHYCTHFCNAFGTKQTARSPRCAQTAAASAHLGRFGSKARALLQHGTRVATPYSNC